MGTATDNSCLSCGACCAFYRASFYWAETDAATPEGVPVDMTEKVNDFRVAMRGTSGPQPRCLALLGFVGNKVSCSIYLRRPSVCRDFCASWENGQPHQRCDQARAAWSLTLLLPGQWDSPGDIPKAA